MKDGPKHIYKDNSLARDITKGVRSYRRPSLKLIGKWRQEWVDTGMDHHIRFESFRKHKTNLWFAERRKRTK